MSRRRTWTEITVVLMLSLGASALYSVLQIIDDLSQTTPLGQQSTALNTSTTTVQYVDLARQLLGIAVDLAPVALVCMLLWSSSRPHLGRLGIDRFRVRPDLGGAALIALCIGVPGLALYFTGRALGITVAVDPAALGSYWWTIPVLLLSAVRSGLQEEVIVVGYLYARLGDLGWGAVAGHPVHRGPPRELPPVPGLRRVHRQRGDGHPLRLDLHEVGTAAPPS
ncbi:CPBP family intramembrane glutamate endopeptidase [Curtobacterium sp. MCPF17_052]|uniref:CPBP family intramembrane glutamate endopeptidase n=1 Tax=Curtobacterium sp. MCPF17_052 TaxID=2175655 RepID=UPI0034649094